MLSDLTWNFKQERTLTIFRKLPDINQQIDFHIEYHTIDKCVPFL